MSKQSNVERVLHGSLISAITWIAVPLMINNLIQTLYNLSDALWVGRLGPVEFAATSFVWPILFLFISIGIGIAMAGTSILSQLIGAGRIDEANHYANLIYWLSFLFSVIVMVTGYASAPTLIYWMGGTGDFARFSIEYLRILFLGMPMQFLYFSTNALFQSQGITLLTTILSGLSAALNMVLNPLFIFETIPGTAIRGLGLGVAGAAWATIFSQALLVLVGLYFIRTRSPMIQLKLFPFAWDFEKVKLIARIGIPSIIGQSGAAFGFVIFNGAIAAFGTDTVAAFSLVNRVSGIAMMPAMGIGSGLTIVVGQNIGNRNLPRAKASLWIGFAMATAVTVLLSLPILFADVSILRFFLPLSDDSPILALAIHFLRFALILNPLMGFFSVMQGFFQGTGHSRYAMTMEVIRLWGIRLPIVLLLQLTGTWSQDGIWTSMIISNLLVSILGLVFYRLGRWERPVVGGPLVEHI